MAVTTGTTPTNAPRRHRRRTVVVAGGLVLAAAIAVALVLFQPWQLWIDTTVDDAAPAGAVPFAPSTTPAITGVPTTDQALPTTTPPVTAAAPPLTAAPAGATFVSLDHGTAGQALVLQTPDGQRFVRFEDLDTSNGPDLKVYLSTNPVDGPEAAFDDDIVNLGGLQGNLGNQNYAVPEGVDLSRYRSVVIWCDRFNSAFGAAPLS